MAQATVELVSCQSYAIAGRSFTKGKPQVITDAAEIAMFRQLPEFRVQKIVPVSEMVPKVEDTPDEDVETDDPIEEVNEFESVPLTKLKNMSKKELMEYADSLTAKYGMGLYLDGSEKKAEMVSIIDEAQKMITEG